MAMRYVVHFKIIKVTDNDYWIIEHIGTRYEDAIGAFTSEEEARREELSKLVMLKMSWDEMK